MGEEETVGGDIGGRGVAADFLMRGRIATP